jgi:glyoxylase-like metal-dependent hydrolase (beta-lactamase superfamily II)
MSVGLEMETWLAVWDGGAMNLRADFSRRGFLGTTLLGAGLAGWAGGKTNAAETKESADFRNPFVYRFKIGEFEAFSISDGHLPISEGLEIMWPQEDRDAMTDALKEHGEAVDQMPLFINILVVRAGKKIAIFDSGFGRGNNPQIGWLEAGLAAVGISPDQVTASFLSHGHSDHIGGFVRDGKPVFPNAPLYVLEDEVAFWRSPEPDFSKSKRDRRPLPGMVRDVRASFDALGPLLKPVKPGTTLWDGGIVMEAAPGHTAGHACFRIRSGDDELLHLMDLSHHSLLMFANPEWTIAFDHDPELAVITRKKFWSEAAAKHTRCYGFHLPWPGLGRIVKSGSGYRWWAESWSWR